MKKVFLLASAAILAAGCASQESGETAHPAEKAATEAPATDAVLAGAEMASVTGTMGCGRCTSDVTPACAAALETDAGVVWILEGVDDSSRLFKDRGDLGVVTVTGTKRAEGGLHYLKVASYEVGPAGADESEEG